MMKAKPSRYNGTYRKDRLNRVAFPMGGLGAGMICLEGTGALSHVSLRHAPEVNREPLLMAALYVKGARTARVLEGPIPGWKIFGKVGSGNGLHGASYGFPRFARAAFRARFPFGTVELSDPAMPVTARLTGWSPFVPGDADASSLPVCALEYTLQNRSARAVEAVLSFHAQNFLQTDAGAHVRAAADGFVLVQPPVKDRPWDEAALAVSAPGEGARVDCAWFRGGWFDPLTTVWNTIASGGAAARGPHAEGGPGGGGSLYVPLRLRKSEERTIRIQLAWHVPRSNLRFGANLEPAPQPGAAQGGACAGSTYVPWYAGQFASAEEVAAHWSANYESLRTASAQFRDCFQDTTLPPEVVEAVAANLCIIKSPTCLRQDDGRLWAWEGCGDNNCGCCHGTCTHVWNYAQAIPHLFPALERTLRETEFRVSQDERGHQNFRSSMPIREPDHGFHAAADGQLGGIVKAYRDWRISGDTAWMKALWPRVKSSLDYCIATWDPDRQGVLREPHHNTYDIEFWGPDGMCTSFYLNALQAAVLMGREAGADVAGYEELLARSVRAMQKDLWNGKYFYQKVEWKNLRAGDPVRAQTYSSGYSAEALAILQREGPKYQYGTGCLSDGVLGDWLGRVSGLPPRLDPRKVAGHLDQVFRHNFRESLADHANPQRPGYAFGTEAGLLLCSWPQGGKPALPFVYSDEVWTGIEYQVASHLILAGRVEAGLKVVRAARDRYDGRIRNPFNEYECGHWYARAMSSYALLQALSGARYDAVEKTLHLDPAVRGDFRAFLATATGYGTVGVRKGKPFLHVRQGTIEVEHVVFRGKRTDRGR